MFPEIPLFARLDYTSTLQKEKRATWSPAPSDILHRVSFSVRPIYSLPTVSPPPLSPFSSFCPRRAPQLVSFPAFAFPVPFQSRTKLKIIARCLNQFSRPPKGEIVFSSWRFVSDNEKENAKMAIQYTKWIYSLLEDPELTAAR